MLILHNGAKKAATAGRPLVLVSAGTELILFLVAGTALGFGFSVRMMLITL